MVHADYLFLLTDVEALYTSNPRKDPHAKAIDIVESVTEIRKTGMWLLYRSRWGVPLIRFSEHCDTWLEARDWRDGDKVDCC